MREGSNSMYLSYTFLLLSLRGASVLGLVFPWVDEENSARLRLLDERVEVVTVVWARRQARATVASIMARRHLSLCPDHFPHQARETITNKNPFRPGARSVVQSMSTAGGCIYSALLAPLVFGCSDFHQDHHCVSNAVSVVARKTWSFHGL